MLARGGQTPGKDSAISAGGVGQLALLVLVIGLAVYGVRVCAQGYRSNRHLQAVAESKAAAMSTFTRLSSSIAEEEIRATVALALAQAVFATEDTGLVAAGRAALRIELEEHAHEVPPIAVLIGIVHAMQEGLVPFRIGVLCSLDHRRGKYEEVGRV